MGRRLVLVTTITAVAWLAAIGGLGGEAFGQPRSNVHTYRVPAAALRFGLPGTWRQIDSRTLLSDVRLAELIRSNPSLSGVFAQLTQPNSPLKFFAFDPNIRNGFASNANVTFTRLPFAMSQTEFLRQSVAAFAGYDIRHESFGTVKLPGGTAVQATYQFHLGTPSGKIWVSIRQYSFKRGLLNTVVTYTTLPAYEKSYRPTFLASAKSIRFTN